MRPAAGAEIYRTGPDRPARGGGGGRKAGSPQAAAGSAGTMSGAEALGRACARGSGCNVPLRPAHRAAAGDGPAGILPPRQGGGGDAALCACGRSPGDLPRTVCARGQIPHHPAAALCGVRGGGSRRARTLPVADRMPSGASCWDGGESDLVRIHRALQLHRAAHGAWRDRPRKGGGDHHKGGKPAARADQERVPAGRIVPQPACRATLESAFAMQL